MAQDHQEQNKGGKILPYQAPEYNSDPEIQKEHIQLIKQNKPVFLTDKTE